MAEAVASAGGLAMAAASTSVTPGQVSPNSRLLDFSRARAGAGIRLLQTVWGLPLFGGDGCGVGEVGGWIWVRGAGEWGGRVWVRTRSRRLIAGWVLGF